MRSVMNPCAMPLSVIAMPGGRSMRFVPACTRRKSTRVARYIKRPRANVRRDTAARPEMLLIGAPQRLHRDVERAAAERAEALAGVDDLDEFG